MFILQELLHLIKPALARGCSALCHTSPAFPPGGYLPRPEKVFHALFRGQKPCMTAIFNLIILFYFHTFWCAQPAAGRLRLTVHCPPARPVRSWHNIYQLAPNVFHINSSLLFHSAFPGQTTAGRSPPEHTSSDRRPLHFSKHLQRCSVHCQSVPGRYQSRRPYQPGSYIAGCRPTK